MSQIKMIGLDLDGTLLNTKKELSRYSREILQRVIQKGIIVLVATGRPFTGIPEELRNFHGMRYALTSNGARILDTEKQEVLVEELLPRTDAIRALKVFRKYDTMQEIYYDGQGYADKEKLLNVDRYHHNPHMRPYVKNSRKGVPDVLAMAEEREQDMDKIQGLFADMEERAAAWKELEQDPKLELVGSLKYNIEINTAGVNKGKGLVKLGELLGIRREEIMACGDGDNDITMLKEVGFGVAMANAEQAVLEAADYITSSNDEDGVAKAIEKFVLSDDKMRGEKSC